MPPSAPGRRIFSSPCSEERSARSSSTIAGTGSRAVLIVDQADLRSRDGKRQRMGHVGDRDAMLRGLHLIHAHHQPGLRIFDVPVGIHDARQCAERST